MFSEHHGSSSLRHWLQRSDWLPTLEATLSLDQESVRRVGNDTIGGPAISLQLRLIRILMKGSLDWSELCAQSWSCTYRVEA